MNYRQVIRLLSETKLSPEQLAKWLLVSNLTYRRWLKKPPLEQVPKEYRRNIAGGVFALMRDGKLSYASKAAHHFLEENLPEFFEAAIGQFDLQDHLIKGDRKHQDRMTDILRHIGTHKQARLRVDAFGAQFDKFLSWGSEWKSRITLLKRALVSKRLTAVDKCVAYGALFYLILPFDLIPDTIPVFGYLDDFGILGFAASYYARKVV